MGLIITGTEIPCTFAKLGLGTLSLRKGFVESILFNNELTYEKYYLVVENRLYKCLLHHLIDSFVTYNEVLDVFWFCIDFTSFVCIIYLFVSINKN